MKISDAGNSCVVGLQWGDEGKGKVVDVLMETHQAVARYAGGANAGHTIVVNGERFALHQLPSGAIRDGVACVLGCGMVLDPAVLLSEINGLASRGVSLDGRLFISDRAHLVMPYHRLEDMAGEKLASEEHRIGTTARGIGPCYADKVSRRYGLRVCDLFRPERFREQVAAAVAHKNAFFAAVFDERTPLDAQAIADEYLQFAEELKQYVCDGPQVLHDLMQQGQRVLFEGAQGSMLDLDHGTYPFVTSSNASAGGVACGAGVPMASVTTIVGAVKAYATRVGSGPFPSEQAGGVGDVIRERGNEYGTTTGRPRRCGWFDAVAVRFACMVAGPTHLAVLHLDTLSGMGDVQMCVGYKLDGRPLDRFPADVYDLARVEPVYETFPGWDEDLSECRTQADLPQTARDYLSAMEQRVGVPVSIVGVGPAREQTVLIEE